MNKISKKIVALVTMAAFVLTLVPAAAFANDGDATQAQYEVVQSTTSGELAVKVTLLDENGQTAKNTNQAKVKVTLTDGFGKTVDGSASKGSVSAAGATVTSITDLSGTGVTMDAVEATFNFTGLTAGGTYTAKVELQVGGSGAFNTISSEKNSAYVYGGAVSAQTSSLDIVNDEGTVQTAVTVDKETNVTGQFDLRDAFNQATNATPDNIFVWAMENGQVTDALVVTKTTDNKAYTSATVGSGKYFTVNDAKTNPKINIKFTRPGTYVVYAGTKQPTAGDGTGATTLGGSTACTITVSSANAVVNSVVFDQVTDVVDSETPLTDGQTLTCNIDDKAITNGIANYTLTATAKDAQGLAAVNEKFELTSSDPSALVLDKAEVSTDKDGQFSIKFKLTKTGEYMIYAKNEDMNFTIKVSAVDTKAEDITTTKSDAQTMLVGSDNRHNEVFTDAVQFKITDASGNEVKNALSTEPAYVGGSNHDKYVEVTEKPDDSTLKADNIGLYWDSAKSVYTLEYTGTNPGKDLTAGTYTVKVSLKNNKTAEASFTLAKFGTVKDLAIDLTSGNVELGDQVALGSNVAGTVYYVDENGIKVEANTANVVTDVSGKALENKTGTSGNKIGFKLYDSDAYTENLLGTEVTITAYDTKVKKSVVKTLTVVDSVSDYTLAFDSENGEVGKTNTVNVSVVDGSGKVVNAGTTMYAYIENSSNADAKVQLTPAAGSTASVTKGESVLKVYADQETVLDIVVVVANGEGTTYAKTLKYSVGEQDIPVDTSVVMTIGSNDFVVNNEVVSVKDAAPYIANDRTYVPFRALGEALGAKVEWDNDARTVTYTLGKTEVVMTIGEKTYTVNGEEKTMDVAPEITGDRTYVPVRFVGEALGFKVTALSAADGTTASVVFQK